MQSILVELKIVEEHYVNGRYLQTYDTLYCLCRDNQQCEEFSQAAMSILSRYNDLENSIANISLELSQQEMRKREINLAFEKLIVQMKRRFNVLQSSSSVYEDQAKRMKEHKDMLRKSLMAVEDDITECDNPKKTELLEHLKNQLQQIIEYFSNLIKTFRMAKDYE